MHTTFTKASGTVSAATLVDHIQATAATVRLVEAHPLTMHHAPTALDKLIAKLQRKISQRRGARAPHQP